jgi:DNA-binding MarR family transcriptional regulator
MDISTVSRGISPLIRDGYVEQVKSDDRRQKKCRITDSGRAIWKNALPLWREAQARVQERIATDSLDTLTELRTKIASLA